MIFPVRLERFGKLSLKGMSGLIKVSLILWFALLSFESFAGYVGNQNPISIFGSGIIKFGVDNPPDDTCEYFNRTFKFDATTDNGRNILSFLLAAKMAGKSINIWYTPSSKPGTTSSDGCSISNMATVNEIGIN